jgi:hypothetical protein
MRPKVFVVSLHRTGTRSVTSLLRSLGLNAQHWLGRHNGTDFESLISGRERDLVHIAELMAPAIDDFDAVSDVPIPVLYRQLATMYRDAKFILVERDPAAWVSSVRRHIGARDFFPAWHYLPGHPANLRAISYSALKSIPQRHVEQVRNHFDRTPGKLGVFHLESLTIARDIASFIGCSGPAHFEFPPIGVRRLKAIQVQYRSAMWRTVGSIRAALAGRKSCD